MNNPPQRLALDCLYAALVTKRATLDQLLWQAPGISLAAQAFLLTIAYGKETEALYKGLSGGLAMMMGLMTWMLFLRHAALEEEACRRLEDFERAHSDIVIHERPTNIAKTGLGERIRCRPIWAWALFLISLGGAVPLLEITFR